jgi:HEAT repeat protein
MTTIKKIDDSDMHLLIEKLGGPDGLERKSAREELVSLGKDSIDYLMELLKHPKHIYRWEAVKTLEEIGDPDSIPLFLEALEDDKSDVRWIAAKGLIKLGAQSIKPLLKTLDKKSDSIFIITGAHHVFFDLHEMNLLPDDFPIDELLAALRNPEMSGSVRSVADGILHKLK